ncbi:AbrB/MazE/SpoVT family DNA-binding domain-containing protein [Labilibaculum euxinus]
MYSLDELLEGINDSNVHDELSWGDSVGNEDW